MSAPQRFRKKPVEIEAQQYTDAESGSEIIQRILDAGGSASLHCVDPDQPDHGGHTIRIRTLEGDMHAALGDWVIRGVQGEFYPCKPDIFAATYEAVNVPMVEALTYADAIATLTAADAAPASLFPVRTVAFAEAILRSRRPGDGKVTVEPTADPDFVVATVELSSALPREQAIETSRVATDGRPDHVHAVG